MRRSSRAALTFRPRFDSIRSSDGNSTSAFFACRFIFFWTRATRPATATSS